MRQRSRARARARAQADGICSIQERTVWTGRNDFGGRSWLVFGGNDAYVETHIDYHGRRSNYFGRVALNNKRVHSSDSTWSDSSSSGDSHST